MKLSHDSAKTSAKLFGGNDGSPMFSQEQLLLLEEEQKHGKHNDYSTL